MYRWAVGMVAISGGLYVITSLYDITMYIDHVTKLDQSE